MNKPRPRVNEKKVPGSVPTIVGRSSADVTRNTKIRPLVGGIGITTSTNIGTLGYCFTSDAQNSYIVTCEHTFAGSDGTIGQYDFGDVVGKLAYKAPDYDKCYVDVAFALVNTGIDVETYTYLGLVNVDIAEIEKLPDLGQELWIEGLMSGHSEGKCTAEARHLELNGRLRYVSLANYPAQAGDSGAPVLGINSAGDTVLFGIHTGRAEIKGEWYSHFAPFICFEEVFNWIFDSK